MKDSPKTINLSSNYIQSFFPLKDHVFFPIYSKGRGGNFSYIGYILDYRIIVTIITQGGPNLPVANVCGSTVTKGLSQPLKLSER